MEKRRKVNVLLTLTSVFVNLLQSYGQQTNTNIIGPVYKYQKVLDDDGKFVLLWNYNDTHIDFEVQVATLGYIGFGISKVGLMNPADIVIGWMQDSQIYFGDYYTTDEARFPMMDPKQDWYITDGTEVNGTTVLRFSRALDTCDPNDTAITKDTMYVIYSYSDADPDVATGMVPYHGTNRGAKQIVLLENDVIPASYPPPNTYMIDFKNYMFPIPIAGSTLQCIVFNMSTSIPPSNLIKFEPVIEPGNERFVYRMVLYRCNLTDPALDGRGFECENEAPVAVKSCKSIVASWSMGAEEFHFPDNVGISMGAAGDPYSYVLEMHYTNFEFTEGVTDSSGLRVTYTTSPRQHDAGMLELGSVISQGWRQVIPHGEKNFVSRSVCTPRCMNWGFDTDRSPMNAIGIIFKGNDVAKTIKLRHFRGGEELPWISQDNMFSNFRHSFRLFKQPITIESWDNLSLECGYDTANRSTVTRGGFSRIEEMCRATLIYYPRKSFDMCLSWSSLDELADPATGDAIPEGDAMSFLGNITVWDANINQKVKTALKQSTKRSLCSSIDRQPAYAIDRFKRPANIREYEAPNVCAQGQSPKASFRIPVVTRT